MVLPAVERRYSTTEILNIIRNPDGWPEDVVRQARLEAADEIETLMETLQIANRQRDESEARALSLMQFVPGEVRVAQIKTLRDAYAAWREWFSALSLEQLAGIPEMTERLLALTVAPMNRKRSVLSIHFNRGMSHDEMNRLHEHLLRFGIRVQGPYRVVEDEPRCGQCKKGGMYTIVVIEEGEEVGIGRSWGDEEFANDLCDLMNMAYDFGKETGQSLRDDGSSDESANARGG